MDIKFIKTLVAIVLYSLFLIFAGWKIHVYYAGYQLSIEQKLEKVIDNKLSDMQQNNAKHLEDVKDELSKKHVEVIEKKIPMIIDRPIYMNTCVDEVGVDALRQFKEDSNKIRGLKDEK